MGWYWQVGWLGKWQQLRPWMSAKQPRKTSDGQVGNCCHHPLLSHTSMLHWQHVADTQEAAWPRLPAICAIAGSGPHGIRGHRQQSVGPLCLSSSSWLDFLLPLLRQWAVMVVTVFPLPPLVWSCVCWVLLGWTWSRKAGGWDQWLPGGWDQCNTKWHAP